MDWSNAFGPPQPLKRFLDSLQSLPDQWLYVSAGVSEIEAQTLCQACVVNARDLNHEEQAQLDEYPETIGLKCFLCLSQLADIIANLRQQRPSFTERDLVAAVNFYWRHDAFIDVQSAA